MLTRRKFLSLGALAVAPAIMGAEAIVSTPSSLRISRLTLPGSGTSSFVHFTDLHYAGDAAFAAEVVSTINSFNPAFVCFTGDLTEDCEFAGEAFDFIRQIKSPVYGIPGNHDYGNGVSFSDYQRVFANTGGAWMPHRTVVLREHNLELVGLGITGMPRVPSQEVTRRAALIHYPVMADHLDKRRFDLILAGHSHGGQVRLPFWGPVALPDGVGRYDLGHYETACGPLYVNAGIGTLSSFPVRINCPPELTVVTL